MNHLIRDGGNCGFCNKTIVFMTKKDVNNTEKISKSQNPHG